LLEALLTRLDERYALLRSGERATLFADWRARLAYLGEMVTVTLPGGELRGIAEDVASDGTLLLRDAASVLHTIHTGDVGGFEHKNTASCYRRQSLRTPGAAAFIATIIHRRRNCCPWAAPRQTTYQDGGDSGSFRVSAPSQPSVVARKGC